jgi:hypothetical protein
VTRRSQPCAADPRGAGANWARWNKPWRLRGDYEVVAWSRGRAAGADTGFEFRSRTASYKSSRTTTSRSVAANVAVEIPFELAQMVSRSSVLGGIGIASSLDSRSEDLSRLRGAPFDLDRAFDDPWFQVFRGSRMPSWEQRTRSVPTVHPTILTISSTLTPSSTQPRIWEMVSSVNFLRCRIKIAPRPFRVARRRSSSSRAHDVG